MRIAVLAFTEKGWAVARRIIDSLNEECLCYDKRQGSAADFVAAHFADSRAIIFVGAVGIAVRLSAPHICSKASDPAVIAVDELGHYVIPLLSGHLGGANQLAVDIATAIDAEAVITTATDINNVFAVDVWSSKHNCRIINIDHIKYVSAALLKGQKVGLACDFPIIGELPAGIVVDSSCEVGICISLNSGKKPFAHTLNLVPRILILGLGCRRDTDSAALARFVLDELGVGGCSMEAVGCLASIDLKADEKCLLDLAEKYRIPFKTFSAEQLGSIEGDFSASSFVARTTGVDNVCERSAMAAVDSGQLLQRKKIGAGMTIAIAAEKWRCEF